MTPGHALYLACRSLWWYRGRGLTIVLCLALTLWLPVTVNLLLNQFRSDLLQRAENTPLVIGAKGSSIDLALNALYFDTELPEITSMAEAEYIDESGFAMAVPLHTIYRTQSVNSKEGVPIVGTTTDYFEFRGMRVLHGKGLRILGDCVLGSRVAEEFELSVGDTILSAPKNAFNLAGDYPLEMNIVGILQPSHSPDDHAVFVDIRTAWIIDGIGHGHQDMTKLHKKDDRGMLLDKSDDSVTASAAVLPFTRITPENVSSIHFHGNESTFPVSAILAVPNDTRGRTMLLGRYATERAKAAQCVKPTDVVGQLMNIVFRVERLVWLGSLLSAVVTATLVALVVFLTVRLRSAELQTMQKIGGSRGAAAMLMATELLLMLAAGTLLAAGGAWVARTLLADSLRNWVF